MEVLCAIGRYPSVRYAVLQPGDVATGIQQSLRIKAFFVESKQLRTREIAPHIEVSPQCGRGVFHHTGAVPVPGVETKLVQPGAHVCVDGLDSRGRQGHMHIQLALHIIGNPADAVLESLNLALENYPGTLIFVSHDRDFVSTLATRVIEMTPEGIVDYSGTYDEYLTSQGIVEKSRAA